jgi:hypothetical protein
MNFYRATWLAIYIVANLIAAMAFAMTGELDGDLIGYPLPGMQSLVIGLIAVVASYLIWMGPVFGLMESFKTHPIIASTQFKSTDQIYPLLVGTAVLVIQLFFMTYNLQQGVNIAGSRLQSESSLKYFWILLAPDALFLVYYGLYRKSKLFGINLSLYLISNALRGWLGTWLIIFFIEGAYRVREGRLGWKNPLILMLLFAPLLPYMIELKWLIRVLGASGELSLEEVTSRLGFFVSEVEWWNAFAEAVRPLVMRFQHLANVVGIMDVSQELSRGLEVGEFKSFFAEGLPQYALEKLLALPSLPDIHVTLLTYLIPEQLPVDTITNTHVGLVGWFWIAPHLIPYYLLYVLVLSYLGVWLAKKVSHEALLVDIIWFSWLGYLMNGWFAAYIEFLQALIVMIGLRYIAIRLTSGYGIKPMVTSSK